MKPPPIATFTYDAAALANALMPDMLRQRPDLSFKPVSFRAHMSDDQQRLIVELYDGKSSAPIVRIGIPPTNDR